MTHPAAVLALPLVVGAGIACGDSTIRHPLPEALPDPSGPTLANNTSPPAAMEPERAKRWMALRRAVLDARPGAVIGVLEGGGPSMFGSIQDVEIDGRGEIYVLDRLSSAIIVFDSTGTILAELGGEGDGPLEFRLPVAFDLLENGTLVVEELGGALKLFERHGPQFEFLGRTMIASFARDMCALGNRVFAESGFSSYEGLVAEYAPDSSTPVRSFGDGYAFGSELTRMQMNHGSLACLSGSDRVAFGFRTQPRVDLYSSAGKRLWTAGVADYVQGWTLEAPPEEGGTVATPRPPSEWLFGLRPFYGDHLIAVYNRQMSSTSEEGSRTYLVDASTGWGALIGVDLERIVAIGGSMYVTMPRGLYPRLRVWHLDAAASG